MQIQDGLKITISPIEAQFAVDSITKINESSNKKVLEETRVSINQQQEDKLKDNLFVSELTGKGTVLNILA